MPICFLFCVRFDHKNIIYQEKYEYTVVYNVVYIIRNKNVFTKQNKKAGSIILNVVKAMVIMNI